MAAYDRYPVRGNAAVRREDSQLSNIHVIMLYRSGGLLQDVVCRKNVLLFTCLDRNCSLQFRSKIPRDRMKIKIFQISQEKRRSDFESVLQIFDCSDNRRGYGAVTVAFV